MNKHLHNSLRALFLSLAVLLSLPMLAVEVEIDGINYDLVTKAKLATVIKKSSGNYSGEVVIPESVEFKGVTHSVTSIGDDAFRYCSGLTSVTIGSGVTSIGEWAFAYCSGLTSVTIPNSVTSIGESAFYNCSRLTSVHISDIAAWCNIDFEDYNSNPLDYAYHLYLNGEEVKDLVIPNSVTSIGEYAFYECYGLTSVTIPNSVTSIGSSAFSGCSGLTSVTIPNSVTRIGSSAFASCSGLTSITIPNSVTSIGGYAFASCSGLTSITIPNSVTSIGESAFAGCSALTSVTIPNSVTSIGESAFAGCSALTSVTIPNSVTSIGERAFYECSGLTSVTIGNSVTSIEDYVFRYCSGLTSVTIGNSVMSIGNYAFQGCSSLTSVTIPNSVKSIGKQAFYECSGLTSVTIPNSVTSIGDFAFVGCSGLTSVTIGNSVTSIGDSAFRGCSGLTSVHISDIAAWCNIDFAYSYSNPLYYAHHLYSNGEEVKDLVIPNSVTSIKNYAFFGCSGLTSVTIGNSVTSIGKSAFSGCSGLTSVTIPNSVTSIWYAAFRGCSGLTSVTIGNSVTSIGGNAFYGCSELLDVYCYAEKVPSTESNAFDGSYPEYATLHVPDASIDSYKAKTPWRSFGKIVGLSGEEPEQPEVPEVEKCATPVVTYAEGKLSFSCETEGAEFVTDITDSDIKKYYDAEIELSATYNIEVFATKANCENSDTVSVALVWVENGNVDEETGVISVPAAPVLVQGNGGILTVSGVVQNTEVVVYTISGTMVARATATDGTATISTGLQSGTIVIVKFGNKSVKVRI